MITLHKLLPCCSFSNIKLPRPDSQGWTFCRMLTLRIAFGNSSCFRYCSSANCRAARGCRSWLLRSYQTSFHYLVTQSFPAWLWTCGGVFFYIHGLALCFYIHLWNGCYTGWILIKTLSFITQFLKANHWIFIWMLNWTNDEYDKFFALQNWISWISLSVWTEFWSIACQRGRKIRPLN